MLKSSKYNSGVIRSVDRTTLATRHNAGAKGRLQRPTFRLLVIEGFDDTVVGSV